MSDATASPANSTPGAGSRYLLTGGSRQQSNPLTMVDAEGAWVTLADGRRLLDLHGQHMCLSLGHRHPAVVEALHRAVDGVDYAADFAGHASRSDAATLLVEETMAGGEPAGAIRFVSSGSEATEMAMLLARLFTNRPIIVTRDLAFHGWTAAGAAATGAATMRSRFIPADGSPPRVVPSPHPPYPAAPSPLCRNCPLGQTYPSCQDREGTIACVRATERMIRSIGVEQVAGFVTELWHGAGAFLVPDEYPAQIREMCDRLGILWIDDEAIGGPARTGAWWAFQHYGVAPDIVTMAKGITNAAVPAGACAVSNQIAEFLDTGYSNLSSTFSGHPLATAAIVATISTIAAEGLVGRAAELGGFLEQRLSKLVSAHPHVTGLTGRGLLWGIEVARDPATGDRWVPHDRWYNAAADGQPSVWPSAFVARACLQREVLLIPYAPNTVTIAPPLTVTEAELEIGLAAIDEALTELARAPESN